MATTTEDTWQTGRETRAWGHHPDTEEEDSLVSWSTTLDWNVLCINTQTYLTNFIMTFIYTN